MTGISGSGAGHYLREVATEAASPGHEHEVRVHDVGEVMQRAAEENDPNIRWDRILDADPKMLRFLRALAFERVTSAVLDEPNALHLVDLHLSFRWKACLTNGLEPHMLKAFVPYVRCFINLIEDLPRVRERLASMAWGERQLLELLVWRDEELYLTDLFAGVCDRVDSYAVATGEPPSHVERLLWHPEMRKVYLSFPITAIQDDDEAKAAITSIRDDLRAFLVVFDPYACRDYDETYHLPEMQQLRREVGEATVDRDFRFIDQAEAVVVFFPKKVPSKGVDAEMNHARRTGKPIYVCSPEDLGGGPFAVPPSHFRDSRVGFVELLRNELGPLVP